MINAAPGERTSLPPANRKTVDNAAKQAVANPIFGDPPGARPVIYGDLGNGVALKPEQRRQESMGPVKDGDFGECSAADDAEGASRISDPIPCNRIAKAVGNNRRKTTDAGIMAMFAKSADSVLMRLQGRHKRGQINWIMLTVGIEGNNETAFGLRNPRGEGGALPEIAHMQQVLDLGKTGRQFPGDAGTSIGTGIIHNNDLRIHSNLRGCSVQLLNQLGQVPLLVEDRKDDR